MSETMTVMNPSRFNTTPANYFSQFVFTVDIIFLKMQTQIPISTHNVLTAINHQRKSEELIKPQNNIFAVTLAFKMFLDGHLFVKLTQAITKYQCNVYPLCF